jgi:hypothetical protein
LTLGVVYIIVLISIFNYLSIWKNIENNKDLKLTAFLKLRYGLVGTFFCGKFVFHEKDIKFGHVIKLGVESGVFFGVEFGVIFGVDFGVIFGVDY